MDGYTMFDTALGRCGVAWRGDAVIAVQLPEDAPERAVTRLAEASGTGETTPPESIRRVVEAIVALLDGEPVDLSGTPLDLSGVPAFHRKVYDIALTIQPGETLTYGDIAQRLGLPGSARAVGQALGRNPVPIVVPCHRVLAAGGRIGGFSAGGGATTKHRMLDIERAHAPDAPPTLFDL